MLAQSATGGRFRAAMRHVPNLLSVLRLLSVPVLLGLAWYRLPVAFLVLLLVSIVTDALDGWIARRFDAVTAIGIRLDSIADFSLYVAVPLGGWLLWPDLVVREWPWLALIVVGYVLPGALSLARFHRLSSYHTWSAKLAVAVNALALFILFASGIGWPLHVGAPLALLAGLEQSAITLLAAGPRDDLPTIWHLHRRPGSRR